MSVLKILVDTKPVNLSATAERSIQTCERYDWILFTSKNTVTYFMQAQGSRQTVLPKSCRVAAIGPETARALRKEGFTVSVVPKNPTVETMIEQLGSVQGLRILFPRSVIAPQQVVRTLRKKGAIVRTIPLYTTVPVLLSQNVKANLLTGTYTALSFSSPSGVDTLLGQISRSEKKLVLSVPAICIGPTTLAAAKIAGFSSARTLRS